MDNDLRASRPCPVLTRANTNSSSARCGEFSLRNDRTESSFLCGVAACLGMIVLRELLDLDLITTIVTFRTLGMAMMAVSAPGLYFTRIRCLLLPCPILALQSFGLKVAALIFPTVSGLLAAM
uniref:Uncharacterized protein n=1 Tax=Anopheles culicifacies TaxID=139723 RepID=A0A182M3F7_9DIPT